MAQSEKFCLRWNDFESNISAAFRELRDDKDFFDVTLACDDEQIQAHKVILSACSPFFRDILRRNHHQHPLLYLKGVKYTDLQAVLNFMYHGEVNVAQEELNSFLAVAEDLRVKGLTQNQSGGNEKKVSGSYNQPQKPVKPNPRPPDRDPLPLPKRPRTIPTSAPSYSDANDFDEIQEVVPVKTEPRDPLPPPPIMQPSPVVPIQQDLYATPPSHALAPADDQSLSYQDENYEDYAQYDEQDYEGMQGGEVINKGQFQDPSDLLQFVREGYEGCYEGNKRFACTLCTKFAHKGKANVRNHVESVHFPNTFQYPCDQCDNFFPSKNNVQLHRSRVHKQK